jgi:hypothetical protein
MDLTYSSGEKKLETLSLKKYSESEISAQKKYEMTKVTLKMRLPSATLFAPIELPTRLQIPS